MTKEDDKDFENSTKCWICDQVYVEGDDKVRDHCHITGRLRGSAQKDCMINVKSNYKTPIVFQKLKNCDSYLIMQELGIFSFKVNVIPSELEK